MKYFNELLITILTFFVFYFGYALFWESRWKGCKYQARLFVMIIILMISIITVLSCCIHMPENAESIDDWNRMIVILLLMIAILSMMIFELYKKITSVTKKLIQEQRKLQVYQMQEELYGLTIKNINKLSSLKHDLKNHMLVIADGLERQEYAGVKGYLKEIEEYMGNSNEVIITNHKIISAVLTAKQRICKNKSITFEHELYFGNIYIQDMDLNTLLANLLDNAVEAAERCEESKRKIELEIIQEKQYLMFSCTNTYEKEPVSIGDTFLSGKKSRHLHSLGLKNVKEVVKKYKGDLKIQYQNGIFDVQAILVNEKI